MIVSSSVSTSLRSSVLSMRSKSSRYSRRISGLFREDSNRNSLVRGYRPDRSFLIDYAPHALLTLVSDQANQVRLGIVEFANLEEIENVVLVILSMLISRTTSNNSFRYE